MISLRERCGTLAIKSQARRLHNWGYEVEVVLATRDLSGVVEDELAILENMDVGISTESASGDHSVALEG